MRQTPILALLALTVAAPAFAQNAPEGADRALAGQSDHGPMAGHGAHSALAAAIAAPNRSAESRARDAWRHPMETLTFFGIEPDDTVVELIPYGGWYTEILAPYLRERGRLYAAQPAGRAADALRTKLAGDPVYANVRLVGMPPSAAEVPDGSVDAVITFRNMHNLVMRGDGGERAVLARAFAMLKPGGTLGIVDHRLPEDRSAEQERTSGYLKVSTVRAAAEAAGFRYAGASEVNANPRDTADHPGGVWSLPPTLRGDEADRARFQAIGESDRMTLRFVKPE